MALRSVIYPADLPRRFTQLIYPTDLPQFLTSLIYPSDLPKGRVFDLAHKLLIWVKFQIVYHSTAWCAVPMIDMWQVIQQTVGRMIFFYCRTMVYF